MGSNLMLNLSRENVRNETKCEDWSQIEDSWYEVYLHLAAELSHHECQNVAAQLIGFDNYNQMNKQIQKLKAKEANK